MPTEIFVLKLIVTPLLIAAATLVARRWGPGVGGNGAIGLGAVGGAPRGPPRGKPPSGGSNSARGTDLNHAITVGGVLS